MRRSRIIDAPRMSYPFSDLALAQRLERAEACANASLVESRARLEPEIGATWRDFGGTYALFDGVGSPLTQTFGLGLFSSVPDADLEAIESFFIERGAEVFHEASPLGDPSLLQRLASRGYVPVEFTSVMFRPARHEPGEGAQSVRVRLMEDEEAGLWASVAAAGWSSESKELGDFMLKLGKVSAGSRRTYCFLAEIDRKPVGAAALSITGDVALLAGASTIASARRQGAQRALLEARLQFAQQRGCTLAMMGAAPGSASQRNAERQGFRIAYTRVKWMLRSGGAASRRGR